MNVESMIGKMTFWVASASLMREDGFYMAMSMAPAPTKEDAEGSFMAVLSEMEPDAVVLSVGALEVDLLNAAESVETAKKILRGEKVDI